MQDNGPPSCCQAMVASTRVCQRLRCSVERRPLGGPERRRTVCCNTQQSNKINDHHYGPMFTQICTRIISGILSEMGVEEEHVRIVGFIHTGLSSQSS